MRHFDTAQINEKQAAPGRAPRAAGTRRDELFLTTKVWVANSSAVRLMASVDESLEKLGAERVDLLLAHWPGDAAPVEAQAQAQAQAQAKWLNEAQTAVKTRFIGVSNDNRPQLRAAIAAGAAPIVTNQIEIHPYRVKYWIPQHDREMACRNEVFSKIDAGLRATGAVLITTPAGGSVDQADVMPA